MTQPLPQIRVTWRLPSRLLGLALPTMLLACATPGASTELKDARDAYADAKQHPTTSSRPDELVEAREALDAAEAAHERDPGSVEERHLAYIAERRAQLAVSRADTFVATKTREQKESKLLSSAKHYATTAKEELKSKQAEVSSTKEELASERQKRMQAEARTTAALEDLKRVAMVKEEARGLVITLSGAVLFESGKSELLQTAQMKLTDVAKALEEQGDKKIVIEGHTDNRGSDSYNAQLSQARAQAVRNFLVQQGLSAERLEAKGVGEGQPIASNDSAEGRANNRRVEIIVANDGSEDTAMR